MKRKLQHDTEAQDFREPTYSQFEAKPRIPRLPEKVESSFGSPVLRDRTHVRRVNRYLSHQFKRLKLLRGHPHFWELAMLLLQKSESFHLAEMNRVMSGDNSWWRCYRYQRVLNIMKDVKKICRYLKPNVILKRLYIPKADGKRFRPLGIPSPSWRVIMSCMNTLLLLWMEDIQRQHLFLPGKGLHTAWIWIIRHLKQHDNIYEYDLKGFFNSIYLDHIDHVLRSAFKIPHQVIKWLRRCNHSRFTTIKAPKGVDKLQDVDMRPYNEASLYGGISNYSQVYKPTLYNKGKNLKIVKMHMKKWDSDVDPFTLRARGTPQGANWSPILATSVLPYSNVFNLPGVAGADDGIYCWNGESIANVCEHINDGKDCSKYSTPQIAYLGYPHDNTISKSLTYKQLPEYNDLFSKEAEFGRPTWMGTRFTRYQTRVNGGYSRLETSGKVGSSMSNMGRYAGIEFSDKPGSCGYIRKDGIWMRKEIRFLGSTWDLEKDTLNEVPINSIHDETTFKKIVGKNYENEGNQFNRLKDELKVHSDSWLSYIQGYRVFGQPHNFENSLYFKMKDDQGVQYYSILSDKSAICCNELAQVLSLKKKGNRKGSSMRLPSDSLTLVEFEDTYWNEKERRGRPRKKVKVVETKKNQKLPNLKKSSNESMRGILEILQSTLRNLDHYEALVRESESTKETLKNQHKETAVPPCKDSKMQADFDESLRLLGRSIQEGFASQYISEQDSGNIVNKEGDAEDVVVQPSLIRPSIPVKRKRGRPRKKPQKET